MRVQEFMRDLLDLLNGANIPKPDEPVADEHFYDDELRRLRQIADVRSGQQSTEYSNSPAEEYAGPEAVTTAAGGGPNKPKHADDIRGNSFKIYRGADNVR